MQYSTNNLHSSLRILGGKTRNAKVVLHVSEKPIINDINTDLKSFTIMGAPYIPLDIKSGQLTPLNKFDNSEISTGHLPKGPYLNKTHHHALHLHCEAMDYKGLWKKAVFPIDNSTKLQLINVDGHIIDESHIDKMYDVLPDSHQKIYDIHHQKILESFKCGNPLNEIEGSRRLAQVPSPVNNQLLSSDNSTGEGSFRCLSSRFFFAVDLLSISLCVIGMSAVALTKAEVAIARRVGPVLIEAGFGNVEAAINNHTEMMKLVYKFFKGLLAADLLTDIGKKILSGMQFWDVFNLAIRLTTFIATFTMTGMVGFFLILMNFLAEIREAFLQLKVMKKVCS